MQVDPPGSWGSAMANSLITAIKDSRESEVGKLQDDIVKLQDEIYRRKQLLDPIPELAFSGEFKLFFDMVAQERLGSDDRKVIATTLKHQYNGKTDFLLCYCSMYNTAKRCAVLASWPKKADCLPCLLARSFLGPVLAGVDCSCQTSPEAEPEEVHPKYVLATIEKKDGKVKQAAIGPHFITHENMSINPA